MGTTTDGVILTTPTSSIISTSKKPIKLTQSQQWLQDKIKDGSSSKDLDEHWSTLFEPMLNQFYSHYSHIKNPKRRYPEMIERVESWVAYTKKHKTSDDTPNHSDTRTKDLELPTSDDGILLLPDFLPNNSNSTHNSSMKNPKPPKITKNNKIEKFFISPSVQDPLTLQDDFDD